MVKYPLHGFLIHERETGVSDADLFAGGAFLTRCGKFCRMSPRDFSVVFTIFFVCLSVFSPAVHKPEKVCWAEAAGTVRDGLRAYTALHYLAQVSPGRSVLVLDGASVGNAGHGPRSPVHKCPSAHSPCISHSWECWQCPAFPGLAGRALPREILSRGIGLPGVWGCRQGGCSGVLQWQFCPQSSGIAAGKCLIF